MGRGQIPLSGLMATEFARFRNFARNLFPSADVSKVRRHLTFSGGGVRIDYGCVARPPLLLQGSIRFVLLQFFPSQSAHRAWKGFCHGCHNEVHYRLVRQCLRSQPLRSHRARADRSRGTHLWVRDPFGGHPGLSAPIPLWAEPSVMARPFGLPGQVFPAGAGERPGAVASETAGRTTYLGAPEYVGNIAPCVVSSPSGKWSLRSPANGRRAIRRLT